MHLNLTNIFGFSANVVGKAEYSVLVSVEMYQCVKQTFQHILWCDCPTAQSPCVRRAVLK
jgi:hypothetical protein